MSYDVKIDFVCIFCLKEKRNKFRKVDNFFKFKQVFIGELLFKLILNCNITLSLKIFGQT